MHLWQFPTNIAQTPRLHFFTNFATKSQKVKPSNLAKPKPNKYQFILQPNFSHLILDGFVTIPHQECSKTTTSLLHQFCYQGTKTRPSHQTWLSQNSSNINSFCNQTFHTSFWMHLWQIPTKIAQKPRLHFFTNFATKSTKTRPSHQTWLSKNPTKINYFCNQCFHTQFWMQLWQFPTKIAKKPRLHFFTNFATNAQKLGQITKLG